MRSVLLALPFALVAACGPSTAAPDSLAAVKEITAPAEETRVVAVLSYASWCGSCKVLDPKINAIRAENTFNGVEFFALDYSAKDTDSFFASADTLGIGETMRSEFADGVKTGVLYLVDVDSGAIVDRVYKSMDEATIKAAIDASVA